MQILYRQNDFRIRTEATLSSFARRVSPSRISLIHTLHFGIHHFIHKPGSHRRNLTFNSTRWKEACQDLQRFTGLQKLKVTLKFDLGGIYIRCHSDPVWREKFFQRILEPLADVKLAEGAEFVVWYTWMVGICDSWPRGQFEMRFVQDEMFWWG